MKRSRKKKLTAQELQDTIRTAAAEGRIEFAPEPPPELVPPPDFCERFAREILHAQWANMWVSSETDLTDIRWDEREAILADLMRIYGVDCSDMRRLNLWRVMQRCREGGHC